MKICVFGLWHLGVVTAACMSKLGYEVVGLDLDSKVIDGLNSGYGPVYEPHLNEMLQDEILNNKLHFTIDVQAALDSAKILWVCFDTPVNEDDIADTDFVIKNIKLVIPHLSPETVIVISSQLPVGSIKKIEQYVNSNFSNKGLQLACVPENLRLGNAIDIFLNPDRVVVGIRKDSVKKILNNVLSSISHRVEWMSIESAEMTKHAINSFLATSVTFANEIAGICELVGADAREVERGLKTESRIGVKAYLSPGVAFSGGTLARDVAFLNHIGSAGGLAIPLISSIRPSNEEHKNWVRRQLVLKFKELNDIKVAVWGLAYKANTDTLRRSLSIDMCDWLLSQGAMLAVSDPFAVIPSRWCDKNVEQMDALDAVRNASALVIATHHKEFLEVAVSLKKYANPDLLILDAGHFLMHTDVKDHFNYCAVGATYQMLVKN